MAGIAFRLQKLLKGESYTDFVRAYLYSSLISSGPFLVVILSLGALHHFLNDRMNAENNTLFFGIVVYTYAFSMIGIAPFIYVVTRYLADRYFLKEVESFTPTFLTVLETIFVVQGLIAAIYLSFLSIPFILKLISFVLYLVLSGIWITMVFLSAARSYLWIVFAFAVGGVATCALAVLLGERTGITGYLVGFTAGQCLCFALLTMRIFQEFGYTQTHDYGLFLYFKKHFALALIGTFYFVGIWIDKILFWVSQMGENVVTNMRLCMNYDTPMFLAYLSVIPSLAFFLAQMETSFVKHYNAYYKAVRERATLDVIRARRAGLIRNVTLQFQRFVIMQGALSGCIILFIYQIADAFNLNPAEMGIFRIGLVAAFLQTGFLMAVNILFYFDLQKELVWLTFCFVGTNAVFTALTLLIGRNAYGFGYTASCLISLLMAFLILDDRLAHLDCITFMKQPIVIPKFKLEAESK